MFIIRQIPNMLTLCNLLCGCLGIIAVSQNNFEQAGWLIIAAGVFDFFDGFAARLLKVSSPIGKDLDSLADMVTFGALPGIMVFKMLAQTPTPFNGFQIIALAIPLLSAVRLAQFNNDTRQQYGFIGLPTPAHAFFYAGIAFIVALKPESNAAFWLSNPYVLGALALNTSLLLVAPLPLLGLKFTDFSFRKNYLKYAVIAISLILFLVGGIFTLPTIILMYVLISLIAYLFKL